MRVTPLSVDHQPAVEALLARDPTANLFPRALIETAGFSRHSNELWLGAWERPASGPVGLAAVALIAGHGGPRGRLVVPAGAEEGAAALAVPVSRVTPVGRIIGPRGPADALAASLGGAPFRVAYAQRQYLCQAPSEGARLPLRQARAGELSQMVAMAAAMEAEDLGVDPRLQDEAGHRDQVERALQGGRVIVGEQGGQIVFKVDVGLVSRHGALVGGTWVPPAHRGRGLATAGMRALASLLLQATPLVALHVNEENRAAVRCYEAAGFQRSAAYRLLSR